VARARWTTTTARRPIERWLRGLTNLVPTYQKVVYANVSTIFTSAVDDNAIQKNSCKRHPFAGPDPIRER
jgi:hypothetical protein